MAGQNVGGDLRMRRIHKNIDETLERIENVLQNNPFHRAYTDIEKTSERLLMPGSVEDEIVRQENEAKQQLVSASKLFTGELEKLKEIKIRLPICKFLHCPENPIDLITNADNLCCKIKQLRESDNSKKCMWCSFELPLIAAQPWGRRFPYNVLRKHVGFEMSIVRVPNVNSTAAIKELCTALTDSLCITDTNGKTTHLPIPLGFDSQLRTVDSKHGDMYIIKDAVDDNLVKVYYKSPTEHKYVSIGYIQCTLDNVVAFDNNGDKLLLVTLEKSGGENKINIYVKSLDSQKVSSTPLASTLIPRTFEPVDLCFGPSNLLFVADGSIPRIVVFYIDPCGTVWQYASTLTLQETLGHVQVSAITVDAGSQRLWIGTTDGRLFRSERSLHQMTYELSTEPNKGLPPGNYQCGKKNCITCKEIEVGARSFVNRRTGVTIPINERLTCVSRGVVYLLTYCWKGGNGQVWYQQYVGITERQLHKRICYHRNSKPGSCKVNVITTVPELSNNDTYPLFAMESMWIMSLQTRRFGLNKGLSLTPAKVQQSSSRYIAIKAIVEENYHVQAGYLDQQKMEYFWR